MNGKPPSLENKAKSSQSIGPEPLAPGFFCLPARLRERAIRESPLRMGHGPRRVGAGVPDGPYVGHGRKTKKQVIRNTFVGATLAVARVGHGRKPGEHLIRLTAFGTFPSRGRLRQAGGETPPLRTNEKKCVGAGSPGPCWTWSEDGGAPPHPPRLIRPCGPPSPQGEGFSGSKPPRCERPKALRRGDSRIARMPDAAGSGKKGRGKHLTKNRKLIYTIQGVYFLPHFLDLGGFP